MSTTIYYPTNKQPQLEIEVVGDSEDFAIRSAFFLTGDDDPIEITIEIDSNERIRNHIRDELVVKEFEKKEKENLYFDLAKEMQLWAEGF